VSRSSTSQVLRSTIQNLQNLTVLILELVNPEGGYAILDITAGVRAATALNATTHPSPLPQPSPRAPPPPEANKVLTNLVAFARSLDNCPICTSMFFIVISCCFFISSTSLSSMWSCPWVFFKLWDNISSILCLGFCFWFPWGAVCLWWL